MTTALHEVLGDTPQGESLFGRNDMAKNNAGGYAFVIDDWARLDRFLVLGTQNGTYYVGQRAHVRDNLDMLLRCLAEDGERTVHRAVEISESGRAPKNDQAIFVLAASVAYGSPGIRTLALENLGRVVRTGSHMLMFWSLLKPMPGAQGRQVKRAVAKWYLQPEAELQVVKYRRRYGWTHRDILRQVHPPLPDDTASQPRWREMYEWICRPDGYEPRDDTGRFVRAFCRLDRATTSEEALSVIKDHPFLTHEMIADDALKDTRVYQALLDNGPATGALLRLLPTLSRHGLLGQETLRTVWNGDGKVAGNAQRVIDRLSDATAIQKSRLHPMHLLVASLVYRSGRSHGRNWDPNPYIIDAMDDAFHLAFEGAPRITSRLFIAVDVSGSMSGPSGGIMGVPGFSSAKAAAAMATCLARKADRSVCYGFSAAGDRDSTRRDICEMKPLGITARTSVSEAMMSADMMNFGATDCALPMLHALAERMEIDTFVILTDNETWCGNVHPAQALQNYRERTGIASKLVVLAFTATEFSIADPMDSGMLDIAGFDSAVPRLVDDFVE